MVVEIDFTSDEAIYLQLRNQIVMGIATARIAEGEALPSVRQMADLIGVNMHTVNKAYTILKQEGILKPDRRRGTIVAAAGDRAQAIEVIRDDLRPVLAEARCRNLTREDVRALVDEVFREYEC
ncbi:MAG: GntR family transcriptional regulator [Lachnospiraceae bacterium]|nr:GntR family transcriptional regulator [Lachnospiraceae bacterium]